VLSAALFDFDGTLVDTTELIYQSLRHATSDVLGRDDIPRETLMANVGTPMPRQMEIIDPNRVDELLESYFAFNKREHDTYINDFPNVDGSLARLREAGIKIAVVTSKRRSAVEMAFESFPTLRELTDIFVTMEDTTEHKPNPEPLLKGLELLGDIPKDEAAYIGDSPHDIEAARAAGLRSVGVSWGSFSEESLRAAGPDHLSSDLDGVVDVLLKL
jgi:pyrophosphatase PpaX